MIASSAAWVEKYKQQIKHHIGQINNINHITWRQSIEILKEEGYDFPDSGAIDLSNPPRTVKVKYNYDARMFTPD